MPEEIKSLRERAMDEFVAMWTWTEADTTARLTVDAMHEYFETSEFKGAYGRFFDLAVSALGIRGMLIVPHAIATYELVCKEPSGHPEYLISCVKARVGQDWSATLELHVLMFATKVLDWDDNWTRACPMDSDESYARYYRLMDQIVLPTQRAIADTARWRAEAEQENAAHRRAQIEAAQATLASAWLEERLKVMSKPGLLKLRETLLANDEPMHELLGDEVYFHFVCAIRSLCT